MYRPRGRASLKRGLPLLILLSLALQHSLCCAAETSSDGALNNSSAAAAPSPVMEDASTENNDTMSRDRQSLIRQQQNLALVFVVGVCFSFAIFALTYCIAYRTIVGRETNRRNRARVLDIQSEEQNLDYGSSQEGSGVHAGPGLTGHPPGVVSRLRTLHYSSKMLTEKEAMMKALGESDQRQPLQDQEVSMIVWAKECAVCLSEFEEGEEMKVLPVCGHCFHETCINMWLYSHTTCPICRLSLLKPPPAADPAIAAAPSSLAVDV